MTTACRKTLTASWKVMTSLPPMSTLNNYKENDSSGKDLLPPDKQPDRLGSESFTHKEVHWAVDSLYSQHKSQLVLPLEERISTSLLPSNLDSQVSDDNLTQELLGKSSVPKSDFEKQKHLVKDQLRKVSK